MESQGNFIYKGKQYKEGGKFTNDKGQEITFNDSIIVKFDEHEKDEKTGEILCNERFIKIKNLEEKKNLIEKLDVLKVYDKVTFTFDNKFTKDGGVVLNLIDVAKVTK